MDQLDDALARVFERARFHHHLQSTQELLIIAGVAQRLFAPGVLRIHAVAIARLVGHQAAVEQPGAQQHRHPLGRIVRQFRRRDVGKAPLHLGAFDRTVVEKHHAGGGERQAVEDARHAQRLRLPVDFRRRKVIETQNHLAALGERFLDRRWFVLARNRQHDAFVAEPGEERLQAQEVTAAAGRVEIEPGVAVIADVAAPQRVVEIDDHKLTARCDGAGNRVGQRAQHRRRAVRMKRQLRGVVEAIVKPGLRAGATHERFEIDEHHARRGERRTQAAADRRSPGIRRAAVADFIGERLGQCDENVGLVRLQRRLDGRHHRLHHRIGAAQRSVRQVDRGQRQDDVGGREGMQRRSGIEQFGAPLIVRALVDIRRQVASGERQAKSAGEKLRGVIRRERKANFWPRGRRRHSGGLVLAHAGDEFLQAARRGVARQGTLHDP